MKNKICLKLIDQKTYRTQMSGTIPMPVRIVKLQFPDFFPKVRKLYKLDNKDDLEVTINLKGDQCSNFTLL